MGFISIFEKMIELFLIIVIGYIARKTNVITTQGRGVLSKLVLQVSLPATILSAVMNSSKLPERGELLQLLIVAFASYIVLFTVAFVFPVLSFAKKDTRPIYQFMMIFGNVGFIGYPVTSAIFGNDAIFYTAVFNMPFNILVYSIGAAMIKAAAIEEEEEETHMVEKISKLALAKQILLTPCMIASILSLVMAFAKWQGPESLACTADILGAVTTPVALVIIGATLAEMPVKEMFSNVRVYVFALVKLLVVPLLTYLVFRIFIDNAMLLGVATIVAAMPVATTGTMMCIDYHSDEKLMAQGTFISTVFSVFTIPLLAMLLQ